MDTTARRNPRFIASTWGCIIALSITACGTTQFEDSSSIKLPIVFAPPDRNPDFSVSLEPSQIRQRIAKSDCKSMSSDMSQFGLVSGYSTRPNSQDELYLDNGKTPSGTEWFLVRSRNHAAISYCGIAYVGAKNGANVSVANVKRQDLDAIRRSVESGDVLCKCKELSSK